ncbi:MAG: hypothetical protein HY964_03555 [Ignavibacteriales bacterium]|nr:hypothetical protein [Ignavibacteriales bacterium]
MKSITLFITVITFVLTFGGKLIAFNRNINVRQETTYNQSCDSLQADYSRQGLYVGLSLLSQKVGGDFKSNRILYIMTSSQIGVVPTLDNVMGFGILAGGRFILEDSYTLMAADLGYQLLQYKTGIHFILINNDAVTIAGGDASYNNLNLNFKGYPVRFKYFEPYILIGLSYSWLNIDKGSAQYGFERIGNEDRIIFSRISDVTYSGIGYSAGLGSAYYIHPRLALTMDVSLHVVNFKSLNGVAGSVDIPIKLSGSGWIFNVGVSYCFFSF